MSSSGPEYAGRLGAEAAWSRNGDEQDQARTNIVMWRKVPAQKAKGPGFNNSTDWPISVC